MTVATTLSPTDVRRALKPVDAWWTALVIDPLAIRILPMLVRVRRLTPNVVTGIAFVVGIFAVAAFGTGHLRAGAVLIELRFFLDCLDGKIARLRAITSPLGAVIDRLADAVTMPAAFAAVGWSLSATGGLDSRLALLPALACCLLSVSALSLDVARSGRDAKPAIEMAGQTSRLVLFARKHRLVLTPSTVEAEAVGLFLGPLVLSGHALGTVELAVVGLYLLLLLRDVALLVSVSRSGERA